MIARDFDSAVALGSSGGDRVPWVVPDGWQQGRGAWGGLVVGALARAVVAAEPDPERILRSVSAELVAPAVVGPHEIALECVRRGSAVSTWRAVLLDEQERTVAVMTAVLGATRRVDTEPDYRSWQTVSPPEAPGAGTLAPLDLSRVGGPVFMQHLDMRPVTGIPGEGARPEAVGWVALREPVPMDAVALIALVDAWWPAGLVGMAALRPIATVAFAANLVIDPIDVPSGPLLHHSFVTAAAEGFTSEVRRLWTPDGRLVVDNLQSIVLIS